MTNSAATAADSGDFARGVRAALTLQVGLMPLAFILGAQGAQHGLSSLGMSLMTALNFAGGSEFAAVALWSAAPSFLAVVTSAWLINSRHIVLGGTLTPYVHDAKLGTGKVLAAFFLMCDECWALSMQEIDRRKKLGLPADRLFSWHYHMGVGVTLWVLWWLTAAAGAAAGGVAGDLTRWGFMMAFPATFIGLVAAMRPPLAKSLPMIVSAAVSALASLALPMHWTILTGVMAGIVTAALSNSD